MAEWEKLLAAAVLASSRQWYKEKKEQVARVKAELPKVPRLDGAPRRLVSWEIHSVEGDATNTLGAMRLKGHCRGLHTMVVFVVWVSLGVCGNKASGVKVI